MSKKLIRINKNLGQVRKNMKHLKSSLNDLRELFEHSITVRHISEPLASFDADHPAAQVLEFMEEKDYDVVGVRKDGLVSGYVRKEDLSLEDGNKVGVHLVTFEPKELLSETIPLVNVFEVLRNSPRAFVLILGQVGGIVTKGDLQKVPVRMWLFGLISLIEMQLLRIIRDYYPDGSWKLLGLISSERLDGAEKRLAELRKRNEAIDLADCLLFCDKRNIVLKSDELWQLIGFDSKTSGEKILTSLETDLRNILVHPQDIITGNWPGIVDLAAQAEEILIKCEKVNVKR